jgi:hypothetical protein
MPVLTLCTYMTCFRVKYFTRICLEDLSKIKKNEIVSWPEFEVKPFRKCIRSIISVGYFNEIHKMNQQYDGHLSVSLRNLRNKFDELR